MGMFKSVIKTILLVIGVYVAISCAAFQMRHETMNQYQCLVHVKEALLWQSVE